MDNVKSDLENSLEDEVPTNKPSEPMEVCESGLVTNGPIPNGASSIICDRTELSLEQQVEINDFIQEKIYSRFVLTISEVKRLYSLRLAEYPPGHGRTQNVPDDFYEGAILKAGGIKQNNQVSMLVDVNCNSDCNKRRLSFSRCIRHFKLQCSVHLDTAILSSCKLSMLFKFVFKCYLLCAKLMMKW